MNDVLVVADGRPDLAGHQYNLCRFEDAMPEILGRYGRVLLMPLSPPSPQICETILEWKRAGLLPETRLFFGTYGGRHLWSPANDSLVEGWLVHCRSERLVLDSDRLMFIPLCRSGPPDPLLAGDDGYVFMGGRKWREIDMGLAAMARSGLPGRVITDIAPEASHPNIEITRERVPWEAYMRAVARARIVLIPMLQIPISHGHTDVVNAILAGRPVVVTAGASCDDYVQHGVNGLLVRDNTVEAWTDAILEAWERADGLAAGARAAAPDYHLGRNGHYLVEMLSDPESRRVHLTEELQRAHRPAAEWSHMRQENFIRREKAEQREILDEGRRLMRERRYEEAMEHFARCRTGHFAAQAEALYENAQGRLAASRKSAGAGSGR